MNLGSFSQPMELQPQRVDFQLQAKPPSGGDAVQRKVSSRSWCDWGADSCVSLEWPNFSYHPLAERILRHVHVIPSM
jgi:hypothetical protein